MATYSFTAYRPLLKDMALEIAHEMLVATAARGELGADIGKLIAETVMAAIEVIDSAPEEAPK